jgi:hypothetical protein
MRPLVPQEAEMEIPRFFLTIEESGLSMWVRNNPFWAILSIHAIGMAAMVGASAVIALRLLGVAPDLPLAPLERLYRFIWFGFWVQVVTGLLLLIGYPTKSLTNWDFYLKIVLIAFGMIVMQMIRKRVFRNPAMSEADMMVKGRALAVCSLVLWFAVVTSARILAYTYTHITYPG